MAAQGRVEEFLRTMAARYVPGRRRGDDVFELHTSDDGRTYRLRITETACQLDAPAELTCAARVETTSDAFMSIMEGRLSVVSALMRRMVKVQGNIALIKDLPRYFDMNK